MTLGPAEVVPAPALTAPPNGLLKTATVIEHTTSDYRWANGVTFSPESGIKVIGFDPCNTSMPDTILSVTDAATTNASPTLTSATAKFTSLDLGKTVTGAGIPAGAYISVVGSGTSVTLSANATATATGVTIMIPQRDPAASRGTARIWLPFAIEAYDLCSTYGWSQADYEGRARRALLAQETTAVEAEFWTPTLQPGNLGLAQTGNNANSQPVANLPALTAQLNTGTAYGPRAALAALVQAAADNRLGAAQIHARPNLVTIWSGYNLLTKDGSGKIYTASGIPVIPGTGYAGTSPSGGAVSATSEWAYVSDPVTIERGPVEVFNDNISQTMRFDRNEVIYRAQRVYLYEMNALGIFGANVNISLTS